MEEIDSSSQKDNKLFQEVMKELKKLYPNKDQEFLEEALIKNEGRILPAINEISDSLDISESFDPKLRRLIVSRYQNQKIPTSQRISKIVPVTDQFDLLQIQELEIISDPTEGELSWCTLLVEELSQSLKKYRIQEQSKNSIRQSNGTLKVIFPHSLEETYSQFLSGLHEEPLYKSILESLQTITDNEGQANKDLQDIQADFLYLSPEIVQLTYKMFPNKEFALHVLKKEFQSEYQRKIQISDQEKVELIPLTGSSKHFQINKDSVNEFLLQMQYSNCNEKYYKKDLHGMSVKQSLREVDAFLKWINREIQAASITPNYTPIHHIVHIVCGAGKHSVGEPVIKYRLAEHLQKKGLFSFYFDEEAGNIFVDIIFQKLYQKYQ